MLDKALPVCYYGGIGGVKMDRLRNQETRYTSIRVPVELHRQIRELGYLTEKSINKTIIDALWEEIPKELKKARKEK